MKAKEAFNFNIERARNLLKLYHEQREEGVAHVKVADILRASTVLAAGALDAYVHDQVSEQLVPFLRRSLNNNPSDLEPIEKLFKRAEISTRQYLTWMTLERPFVQVKKVVDSHLGLESLQNPGTIKNAFSLIGKKDIWRSSAKFMKLSEDDLDQKLVSLARRRNQIVHEGDREKSRLKKHQERTIDSTWVQSQLDFAENLVTALDQSLSQRNTKKAKK